MTRIELKFKIPYGATREILFQTAMRLSFKKKKKKKTQDLIKRRNRLFTEQTGEKKKASATKSLKPKSYFPTKIHTHSDYRFFAVPSNTQIGLACSNLSNRRKKKASATIKTSTTVEISVRSLQQAIYKLSGLCSSTINDS